MKRRRTIAIVANEFFAPELGRMGGFGWAAREASRAIREQLDAELDVVFVSCEHRDGDGWPAAVHGRPLVTVPGDPPAWRGRLAPLKIDAFLTIDFRPSYAPLLRALPTTPLLVWVRDPRSSRELSRLATLRVPGSDERPQGVLEVDCTSLAAVASPRRFLRRRRALFASPAPETLTPRAGHTYGRDPGKLELLPNPMQLPAIPPQDGGRRVAFLGRLDPIKRPWVALELARLMPDVELHLLGQSHFEGPGSWQPDGLPTNVRLHGHIGGPERDDVLRRAALLINTSVSEGLPISFIEALAFELPIVAPLDPEGVVSRFGAVVEMADGDGLGALPAYERAVAGLLNDPARRRRLGREGREWATATHSAERFAARLVELLARIGIRIPPSATS